MKASVMLSALIKLKELVEKNEHNESTGICGNVEYQIEDFFDATEYLKPAFEQWPEYSGDPYFPVCSFSDKSPNDEYMCKRDLWVDEYGASRKRLLDFLISYYTNEVEKG